jgi:hypothetical protein
VRRCPLSLVNRPFQSCMLCSCLLSKLTLAPPDQVPRPRPLLPPRSGTYYRSFTAASYPCVWQLFRRTPPEERHWYEVIREGRPAHLYFDLEFVPRLNPQASEGRVGGRWGFWAGHGAAVHALQPRQLEQSAVVDVGWRSMLSYCSWVYVPA